MISNTDLSCSKALIGFLLGRGLFLSILGTPLNLSIYAKEEEKEEDFQYFLFRKFYIVSHSM